MYILLWATTIFIWVDVAAVAVAVNLTQKISHNHLDMFCFLIIFSSLHSVLWQNDFEIKASPVLIQDAKKKIKIETTIHSKVPTLQKVFSKNKIV